VFDLLRENDRGHQKLAIPAGELCSNGWAAHGPAGCRALWIVGNTAYERIQNHCPDLLLRRRPWPDRPEIVARAGLVLPRVLRPVVLGVNGLAAARTGTGSGLDGWDSASTNHQPRAADAFISRTDLHAFAVDWACQDWEWVSAGARSGLLYVTPLPRPSTGPSTGRAPTHR